MNEQNKQVEKKELNEIDLVDLCRKLLHNNKKIFKITVIGIIIGIVIGCSIPKTYQVSIILSPESGTSATSGLSGIASMFGLGSASTGFGEDALTFNMFPEIVKTTPFALEMLQIPIHTQKRDSIILYDYLNTEKKPWWNYVMGAPGMLLGGISEHSMRRFCRLGLRLRSHQGPIVILNRLFVG